MARPESKMTAEQIIHKRAKSREWALKNADRVRALKSRFYLKNRDSVISRSIAWQQKNEEARKDYLREYMREQRAAGIGTEKAKERANAYYAELRLQGVPATVISSGLCGCGKTESRGWHKNKTQCQKCYGREWFSKNRDREYPKKLARNALRRASKLQATPPWADLKAIENIYTSCPKGFHVDHILPLKGKTVCGLHVSWNLQHLTAEANYQKNNKIMEINP
jgi:hypothetical protein